MKRRERRWELEEPKKEIIPTLKGIMEKENLSLEEAAERAIEICGKKYLKAKRDCFRKLNGHKLCKGCPKYYSKKKGPAIDFIIEQKKSNIISFKKR